MSGNDGLLDGRTLATSLTVKELARAVAWYEAAGFTVDRRVERDGALRAVAMKAGDVRIMLNQDDGAKGWDRVKGQGFSLTINTTQDIDALARRIKERGGVLATEPADMPWGVRMFRMRDPDGFLWTISKPLSTV